MNFTNKFTNTLTKSFDSIPNCSWDWKVGFGRSTTHKNRSLVVGSSCVFGCFERPQPNPSLPTQTQKKERNFFLGFNKRKKKKKCVREMKEEKNYNRGWRISETQEPHRRCLTPLNFFCFAIAFQKTIYYTFSRHIFGINIDRVVVLIVYNI